jgi:hypothetical protein
MKPEVIFWQPGIAEDEEHIPQAPLNVSPQRYPAYRAKLVYRLVAAGARSALKPVSEFTKLKSQSVTLVLSGTITRPFQFFSSGASTADRFASAGRGGQSGTVMQRARCRA